MEHGAGDIQRSIDGVFTFEPTDDGGTLVRYDLEIDLAIPLPGFVKRRAEVRILNTVARTEGTRRGVNQPVGPSPARFVGIDVGGTKALGVALDASGAVVAEGRVRRRAARTVSNR